MNMQNQTAFLSLLHRGAIFGAALTLIVFLTISGARNAQALTILLDFSTTNTDIYSEETGAFNASPFGFSGLNSTQAQQATLDAVIDHYLGYVTNGSDANSTLPNGMELDINFALGSVGNAPVNGDTEYYFLKIGDGLSGSNATDPGIFGAACLSCVRDASGTVDQYGIGVGAIVGSIWSDHIADYAYLASNDQELINLLAGTISHEIGHTLSLEHAGAKDDNPGASLWGVMGSGATSMPIGERVLDREFTYAKFDQLIGAVGLRDATSVPEPGTLILLGVGILAFGFSKKRATV